ncbi:MAG: bifunctional adenosylcobinamide kinase/adenosylcobinamide-phosphate guanylyltransferase [bacterium]|nr:bifunctional adenosylcobinamide kinase/adenosylcobinamide-phosphate guanylyltransferase [bacterium]
MLTLITGGARSGKSRMALELAGKAKKIAFLATGQAIDEEMAARIQKHRLERDERFETLEEPLNLARALSHLPEGADFLIVDCLTLWANNLMFDQGELPSYPQVDSFFQALLTCLIPVVLVTNEVGMGVVPEHSSARFFRDLAGRINQQAAAQADRVVLMVSGLPLTIKEPS